MQIFKNSRANPWRRRNKKKRGEGVPGDKRCHRLGVAFLKPLGSFSRGQPRKATARGCPRRSSSQVSLEGIEGCHKSQDLEGSSSHLNNILYLEACILLALLLSVSVSSGRPSEPHGGTVCELWDMPREMFVGFIFACLYIANRPHEPL